MANNRIPETFFQLIKINFQRYRRRAKKVRQILINTILIIHIKILLQQPIFQVNNKVKVLKKKKKMLIS